MGCIGNSPVQNMAPVQTGSVIRAGVSCQTKKMISGWLKKFARSLFVWITPFAKDGRADTHGCRAFLYGSFHIVRHAHGQGIQIVS